MDEPGCGKNRADTRGELIRPQRIVDGEIGEAHEIGRDGDDPAASGDGVHKRA